MKISLFNYLKTFVFAALISSPVLLKAQNIELIPFIKDGAWGYCDTSLSIKIKPQFDLACPFDINGLAVIYRKQQYSDTIRKYSSTNDSFGEYSRNEIIINPTYHCNLIDKTGKVLFAEWFDEIIERGQSYTLINYKRNIDKDIAVHNLSLNKVKLSGRESIKKSWLIDMKGNVLKIGEGINYLLENNYFVNDLNNKQTISNLNGEIIFQTNDIKFIGFSDNNYLAFNDTAYFRLDKKFKINKVFLRTAVNQAEFKNLIDFLFPFNSSLENYPINESIDFEFDKYYVDPVRKENWHYVKSELLYINEMGDELFEKNYGFIDSTGSSFLALSDLAKSRFSYGYSSIKSEFCYLCFKYFIDKNGKNIALTPGLENQAIDYFGPLDKFIGTYKYGLTFTFNATQDDPEAGDHSTFSTTIGFMNAKGKIYLIK